MNAFQMVQVLDFPCQISGAAADDLVDGHALAIEAWGEERAKDRNSGLLAMAYLWRRFGPPWRGGDDYKSLVEYTLTTYDREVFLWLHLSASGLAYSVGYLAAESLRREARRPMEEWSKCFNDWWWSTHPEFHQLEDTEENRKIISALYWTERTQDKMLAKAETAIGSFPEQPDPRLWQDQDGIVHRVNQALFNAMKELERPVYVRDCAINLFGRCEDSDEPAEQSKYAGYGCDQEAMDRMIADGEAKEWSRTDGQKSQGDAEEA